MKIFVASAFSNKDSGGNKAEVCLLGEDLTEKQKIKVSKQLGCEYFFKMTPYARSMRIFINNKEK